jgi:mRNA interferase RelE/StbE
MKTSFRKSFARDLEKLKNAKLRAQIQSTITNIEAATDLRQISDLKKIISTDNFYRIRVGEYRMGVAIKQDAIEFIRCLHRRDLYRHFP